MSQTNASAKQGFKRIGQMLIENLSQEQTRKEGPLAYFKRN